MKRIKYFSSIIEKLIIILPILLSIIIFICLERIYPSVLNMLKEKDIQNSAIFEYIVEIGIFLISCIPLLLHLFKSYTKRLKTFLYRQVMRIYLNCHTKWIGLFCNKVINIFFKASILKIREQNSIVENLFDLLNPKKETAKIVFLTGESYSGKTTSILMFLEDLIINRKHKSLYEKLEHKIYYYDFDSQFSFENFNNDYSLSKYDRSLLIIDNLHHESEEQFIQIVDLIMSAGNKAYGIFVVLRKPEEILINQTRAMNLYNSISDYCIKVDCSNKAIDLIKKNEKLPIYEYKFQSFLNELGILEARKGEQSKIFIHLYKMYINYMKFYDKKIFKVFKIIHGDNTDKVMLDALISIFILSQNVGKFVKEDYYYVMQELNHGYLSSKSALNTLLEINFIECSWYVINSNQYLMHEELAKIYIRYIFQNVSNCSIVVHISEILFNKFQTNNKMIAWYYSLLSRTVISYESVLFDQVLSKANVKNMLAIMKYYWDFIEIKTDTLYREYGVLNRIVGNENTAHDYLLKSFTINPKPETLLELFEVKHKYYLEHASKMKMIYKDMNSYVHLGFSYWKKHINMHLGKFDFNSYSSDARLIQEKAQWIQKHEPYEGNHLLQRWYIDYFKIFFLSGQLDFNKINQSEGEALYSIKEELSYKINEFNHYNCVYVIADYIQYTILFNLRINKLYPSEAELDFISFDCKDKNSITEKQLQEHALKLYDDTIQIMKKNGDHSFWHVINRNIDLLLQNDECDFLNVETMLERYMQHAFEIDCFEYVAYAHMFLLKMKLISQLIFAHEDSKNDQIKQHIKDFRRFYKHHNEFHENLYAETRLKLYEAMFVYQSSPLSPVEFQTKVAPILEICKNQNYQRELTLIKWLDRKEYCLSPSELKFLYQSYPIIIQ